MIGRILGWITDYRLRPSTKFRAGIEGVRFAVLVVGCGLWIITPAYGQVQVTITGKITWKDGDLVKPVSGARIILEPKNPGLKLETLSKMDGAFSLATDVIGLYNATIAHPDFLEEKISTPLNLALGSVRLEIELIPRVTSSFSIEVFDDADHRLLVSYTEKAKTITGDLADELPITGAQKDIWNAIKIFPGIIAGPAGATNERNRSILFFNGDRIDQVNLTYKSLRIDDPISGDLGIILGGVETVDMTYVSGRFSVDQGPGAGGAIAFEPRIDRDILESTSHQLIVIFREGIGEQSAKETIRHAEALLQDLSSQRANAYRVAIPATNAYQRQRIINALKQHPDVLRVQKPKRYKWNATNYFPGVNTLKGVTLNNWSPRASFSGVIKENRIWFFNHITGDYQKSVFLELPKGRDSVDSLSLGNNFGIQANLTRNSILSAGFIANRFMVPYGGLGPLAPIETTLHLKTQRYFGYVNSETDLRGILLRVGYGAYRSDARETPQGHGVSQFFPDGRQGFAFQNIRRNGRRDEVITSAALPAKRIPGSPGKYLGDHHLKFGLDVSRIHFGQTADRTGYEHYRQNGTLAARSLFGASRTFARSDLETGLYAQDSWNISSSLSLGMGVRWDRDGFLANSAITPRFSAGFQLPWLDRKTGQYTKFSAGFGWIPEKTNMRLLTQPDDQPSIFTAYAADGLTPLGDPSIGLWHITPGKLKMPVSTNVSFGIEQSIPGKIFAQINVGSKRMHNGYAYVPRGGESTDLPPWVVTPETFSVFVYELQNTKQIRYDSLEFALTKQLKEKYDWFGSFSWTPRARSNAALDVNADNPIRSNTSSGIMPGYTPKRLVSWGRLEKRIPGLNIRLGENNAFAYTLEWHDGLPYTINDEEGRQIGEVNSRRLSRFFSLNLRWERRISLWGKAWIIRLGVDNITNQDNPTDINRNFSSPTFGRLYGRQPRHAVFGIRSSK